MYLPSHFEEQRPDVLQALVRAHPLGLLVTTSAQGVQADSVPFILDPDPAGGPGILRAHVARANPLWREARTDVDALVVFQGPQAYISPSLYPSKAETGKVVPTWNYVMVQARGRLRAVDDAAWLRAFVTRLTERHESPRALPWAVGDAPADYIEAILRAIVGIEIPLRTLVGKLKLSQNRTPADRDGIVAGLGSAGDAQATALSAWVADPAGGRREASASMAATDPG